MNLHTMSLLLSKCWLQNRSSVTCMKYSACWYPCDSVTNRILTDNYAQYFERAFERLRRGSKCRTYKNLCFSLMECKISTKIAWLISYTSSHALCLSCVHGAYFLLSLSWQRPVCLSSIKI